MKLKLIKKETGQAMVEFALVLPILLLFIGGIIDFGWLFHNQLTANNASREAARYIAVHYKYDNMNETTATAKAFQIVNDYTSLKNLTLDTVKLEGDDANGGKKIKVKFSGDVILLTPILQAILDPENDGYKINAETTMRIEQ